MRKVTNTGLKYTSFALLATVANLLAQETSIHIYSSEFDVYLGIINGAIVGLLIKYNLDKKYIFIYHPDSTTDDLKKFVMYGFTGVATTIIFWASEISFHLIYKTKTMRYSGATIGLILGYAVKYVLDNRFVFSEQPKQDN